jgi:protein-tyrosine phosphatase
METNENRQIKRVLFLCTGNYYRSRFAEELFNSLARKANLPWISDSCGLACEKGSANLGPIASYTQNGLLERGIGLSKPIRFPKRVKRDDLIGADRIIALNEEEHRPLIQYLFPDLIGKVEFWQVGDIDVTAPEEGIEQMEERVNDLFHTITASA